MNKNNRTPKKTKNYFRNCQNLDVTGDNLENTNAAISFLD